MARRPLYLGTLRALAAAILFGATAPLVQRASAASGALTSGCLLYLGAALASGVAFAFRSSRDAEPGLERRSLRRLLLVALVGGATAPALLVLGLQQIDAASGSLLLALEAPLTLLFAWLVYREHLGRRALFAAGLIFTGAALLAGQPGAAAASFGGLLVAGAALFWALDNVLSRPLADRDPLAVVAGKGALGAAASALLALAFRDPWPSLGSAAALLTIGALGYGVSLQLYLRAQRTIGAGRTASVFAAAPCLGAGFAFLLAGHAALAPGPLFFAAALLIAAGIFLHATEQHEHAHRHAPTDHEHAHSHADGHHFHTHHPMPVSPHSHAHHHEALKHQHEHSEDLHHLHEHPHDHEHAAEVD